MHSLPILFVSIKNLTIWLAMSCLLLSCTTATVSSPQQQYDYAVMDAAVAKPEEVLPLRAIPPSTTVKVVSWVTEANLPCKTSVPCKASTDADIHKRTWVTLAGEVQKECQRWKLEGDPLRRRLEQFLGLPMDPPAQFRKAQFVVMEIARDRLERPCLGIDHSNPEQPHCILDIQPDTSSALHNYVLQQMAGSYVLGRAVPGYPFTRLGYTYDWNPSAAVNNHYGASEFILMPGTEFVVVEQTAADVYCADIP